MEDSKRAVLCSLAQTKYILSDADEDEEKFVNAYFANKIKKMNKRVCTKKYAECTVQLYSVDDFKIYFCLKGGTSEILLHIVEPKLMHVTGRDNRIFKK